VKTPETKWGKCECGQQMAARELDMHHSKTRRFEYHCNRCGRTWLQDNDEPLRERFKDGPSCACGYRLYYLTATMHVPPGASGYRRSHDNYGCLKCGHIYEVRDGEPLVQADPGKAAFQWMQQYRTNR
jgi:transposase-like protein